MLLYINITYISMYINISNKYTYINICTYINIYISKIKSRACFQIFNSPVRTRQVKEARQLKDKVVSAKTERSTLYYDSERRGNFHGQGKLLSKVTSKLNPLGLKGIGWVGDRENKYMQIEQHVQWPTAREKNQEMNI